MTSLRPAIDSSVARRRRASSLSIHSEAIHLQRLVPSRTSQRAAAWLFVESATLIGIVSLGWLLRMRYLVDIPRYTDEVNAGPGGNKHCPRDGPSTGQRNKAHRRAIRLSARGRDPPAGVGIRTCRGS